MTLPAPDIRVVAISGTQTVADIVDMLLPGAEEEALANTLVELVKGSERWSVPRAAWCRVRPHAGVHVVVSVRPAGFAASAFLALVSQLQFALGVAGLGAAAVPLGYVLATGAVLAVGAAINSLIPQPPQAPDERSAEERFRIDGWRNQLVVGEPVPLPLGEVRSAPIFATQPYSEIVRGEQYIRAMFCYGYGPLQISDLRIGEVPVSEFRDVEVEHREGRPSDDPITLVPHQVLEESANIEIPHSSQNKVGVFCTAARASSMQAIFYWPAGLAYFASNGDLKWTGVKIRIWYRRAGTTAWTVARAVEYRNNTAEPFFRQLGFTFPEPGRWELRFFRADGFATSTKVSNRTVLWSVQSVREQYPIAFDKPMALTAIRIRAQRQLSGTLDQANAVVTRFAKDWGGITWAEGLPRNPAAIFVCVLQGNHQPFPVPDAGIDWPAIKDWHAFCEAKGLHYDRDIRARMSLGELLAEIAAAGRASPRYDGARWGVVIDRPQGVVVDHIGPRNAGDIECHPSYIDPPDAIRVRFRDRTNGYQYAERIIQWPGHTGPVNRIEEWSLPGKTDPAEVARETYRRMLEIIHRREVFFALQDGAARTAVRGDAVLLSSDLITGGAQARITRVRGQRLWLDAELEAEPGETYAIKWQGYDASDTVGVPRQAVVAPVEGHARLVDVVSGDMPGEDTVVIFGVLSRSTVPCRVLEIEPASGMSQRLVMTNDAPEIDALADAYVPPDWDPTVGEVITIALPAPATPAITTIATQSPEDVYGAQDRVLYVAASAEPEVSSAIAQLVLEHRLQGAATWIALTLPGADAEISIGSYMFGDVVELRVSAIDTAGTSSVPSAVTVHTVGSDEDAPPAQPVLESITVFGDLGHARIEIAHSDVDTVAMKVFRTPVGQAFDADTDTLGIVFVAANSTVVYTDGDGSRTNLVPLAAWNAPPAEGWAAIGPAFAHTPGQISTLSAAPDPSLIAGKAYRWSYRQAQRNAGSTRLGLSGSPDAFAAAQTANGLVLGELQAPVAATNALIEADAAFDGEVSDIALYLKTSACAPQGAFEYRFAALNNDDIASAISTPITATIR